MKHIFLILILTIGLFYSCSNKNMNYASDNINLSNCKKADFFAYDYHYIDSNYVVDIGSSKFHKTCLQFNLKPENMTGYIDSVAVAMLLEFGNWEIANYGIKTIGFSWNQLSYYLWIDEAETRKLGQQFGFKHAYLFRDYLYHAELYNPKTEELFNQLKIKLAEAHLENIPQKSSKDLLFFANRYNEVRRAEVRRKREERKKQAQ